MIKQLPDFLQEKLNEYRKVYQDFMEYDDLHMPNDETLIFIALSAEIDAIKKEVDQEKGESL